MIREFRLRQIIKRSEAVLARVSERRLLREGFAIGEASTKYRRNRGGARRAIDPRLPLVSKLPDGYGTDANPHRAPKAHDEWVR